MTVTWSLCALQVMSGSQGTPSSWVGPITGPVTQQAMVSGSHAHEHNAALCMPTPVCPVCDVASPCMQYKTREDQKRTDLMARVRVSGGTHKAGVYVQLEAIAWHIAKCTKLNTG